MDCAQVIVPEATAQAMSYYRSGNLLTIIQLAWSFIVPLLFLIGGLTNRMERLGQKWGRNWYFSLAIYLILFVFLSQLFNLPLDFYAGYLRGHDYGYATESLGHWFDHYAKGTLVTLIGALAFVWIFYLLLKKSPKRWWIYSSFAGIGLIFFTSFIQPIWIDPFFNNFQPMKDKQLEQQILALASRAGIEGGRVYEVDMSGETTMLNAYVNGFGASSRIVLWDTTIHRLNTDEILFVMGHEMGHYVLHHIWWGMLFSSVLVFIVFYLIHLSADFLLKRYHKLFRFQRLSEIASVPLFLLLLNFYLFLFSPLTNYFSRHLEHEADRFGLEITQNNQAAGEAFVALQQENLGNPRPGPFYIFWQSTHPPLGSRIDFTNHYCPWADGQPLRYGDHFK